MNKNVKKKTLISVNSIALFFPYSLPWYGLVNRFSFKPICNRIENKTSVWKNILSSYSGHHFEKVMRPSLVVLSDSIKEKKKGKIKEEIKKSNWDCHHVKDIADQKSTFMNADFHELFFVLFLWNQIYLVLIEEIEKALEKMNFQEKLVFQPRWTFSESEFQKLFELKLLYFKSWFPLGKFTKCNMFEFEWKLS